MAIIKSQYQTPNDAGGYDTQHFETEAAQIIDLKTTLASFPAFYRRSALPVPNKTVITVQPTWVNIGDSGYVLDKELQMNLASSDAWDDSTYATAANRKGKDFYIYACQPESGTEPKLLLSANSTVPTGYTATNSRKIGGFHCECADVETISGHALSGWLAGDILPLSVWDLLHRPESDPEGMVWIADIGQWVDIYLASYDGSGLASVFGAAIADGESSEKFHGEKFAEYAGLVKKRLLSRDNFVVAAKGSNEMTNINGSADPNTTGGHTDTAGRRMISNYGLEDCCGVLWQWMSDIHGHPNNYVLNTTDKTLSGLPSTKAQTASDDGEHWLYGYQWQDDGRGTTKTSIDGATNKYGLAYGALARLRSGGAWGNGSICGSRSVILNALSSRSWSDSGARLASGPRAAAL